MKGPSIGNGERKDERTFDWQWREVLSLWQQTKRCRNLKAQERENDY